MGKESYLESVRGECAINDADVAVKKGKSDQKMILFCFVF